jgi:hypothetical protein
MRSGCSFFALRRLSKHFTDRRGVVGQTTPRHITAAPQRCASSRRHAPAAVVVPSSTPARPRRRRRANATDRTLAGTHERVDGADECVRRLLVWYVTAASQLDLPSPPHPRRSKRRETRISSATQPSGGRRTGVVVLASTRPPRRGEVCLRVDADARARRNGRRRHWTREPFPTTALEVTNPRGPAGQTLP